MPGEMCSRSPAPYGLGGAALPAAGADWSTSCPGSARIADPPCPHLRYGVLRVTLVTMKMRCVSHCASLCIAAYPCVSNGPDGRRWEVLSPE